MKTDYQWRFDGKNSLELQKPNLEFNQYFNCHDKIIWRGVSIEIKINSHRSGMPVTTEYSFMINEKTYNYTVSRTYGGGKSSGKLPPPIISVDYILTVHCNGLSCILREIKTKNNLSHEDSTVNPFKVIKLDYPAKEKKEMYFKSEISAEQKKSIFEDNPTIELENESLTFDNGKLIYGAEDIYIKKDGLQLLFKAFDIDLDEKHIFLEKIKEMFLYDYEGFKKFIELKNIPFQTRKL